MAYLNTFNVIPARPAFGSKLETSESSYYIESKSAKATFCNALKCPKTIKVKNQSDLIALRRARYVDTLRCKPPYTNYALNNNLYTKMNFLNSTCVINTLATDTCPNTRVNPSNQFFTSYYIDPNGSLFGNSQCGYSNFLQYRRLYTQYSTDQYYSINFNGSGYVVSENDLYKIITFNENGNITFTSFYPDFLFNLNYIVVGGGGGGGSGGGGGGAGGGGGQVQYGTLSMINSANFSVIVGNGGTGGVFIDLSNMSDGANGQNSSMTGTLNVTSIGGSGGKKANNSPVFGYGGNGGNSGSGGAGGIGATYTQPAGNGVNGGGGGGGDINTFLSGAGVNNTLANPSFMNTINNYGGGGGGAPYGEAGNNAGAGGSDTFTGNGVPNFGGGGGGGSNGGYNGGNGGSGVVIFYIPK